MLLRRILHKPVSLTFLASKRPSSRHASQNVDSKKNVSFHYGDHNPSPGVYYGLVGLAFVVCGVITWYRYNTKQTDDVGIKHSVTKWNSEYRTNNSYPVEAWPNIEHALTVIYGFDISNNFIRTLSTLKFARQSISEERPPPEFVSNGVDRIERKIKKTLSLLVSNTLDKNSLSEGAFNALNELYNEVQKTDNISWDSLDEAFSSVDWPKESPLMNHLNEEVKENIIKRAKHLTFEANSLERDIEKYLVGSLST